MNNATALGAFDLGFVRAETLLFKPVTFQLNPGDLLCIEGENGIGKSSLLRVLATLNSFDQGKLNWYQQDVAISDYAEQIHYVAHHTGLKFGLTVKENLLLFNALHLNNGDHVEQVIHELYLDALRNRLAKHLSAGQKRRLGLARLWLQEKTVWILDEPFTSLDQNIAKILIKKMGLHLDAGGIIILSSHHAEELEELTNIQRLRLQSAC